MNDMDGVADILQDILEEIRGMRKDFNEFSSYGVQNMKETVADITGPTRCNLQDVHSALNDIGNSLAIIEINTNR